MKYKDKTGLFIFFCSFLAEWLFCDVRYQALLFSQAASILFLVAITYDRLLCIAYHLRYHTIMTFEHFIMVSFTVWSTATICGCILPHVWKNSDEVHRKISHVAKCELVQSVSVSQFRYFAIPAAIGGSVIIISMYIYILGKARNMLSLKPLCTIPNASPVVRTAYSSSFVSSESPSESRTLETIEKLKEKRRATFKQLKTFVIVVGVFLLCWCPFLLLLAIQSYGYVFTTTMFKFFKYSNYPALLNSGLNPIIYAWRMKDFRLASLKLCRRSVLPAN